MLTFVATPSQKQRKPKKLSFFLTLLSIILADFCVCTHANTLANEPTPPLLALLSIVRSLVPRNTFALPLRVMRERSTTTVYHHTHTLTHSLTIKAMITNCELEICHDIQKHNGCSVGHKSFVRCHHRVNAKRKTKITETYKVTTTQTNNAKLTI